MASVVPRVRVVVLNYNGAGLTLECFRHLLRTEWPSDRLELVCVDNASIDGSADAVEAEFPTVRVIRTGSNIGFPANNRALEDLDGVDMVALINNDAFVEPGWLAPLVRALDADPSVGAACPKILLAQRFVEVELVTDGFEPGDGRRLGVQLRAAAVTNGSGIGSAHLSGGGWGRETDRSGVFEWTPPVATIRVPVEAGRAVAGESVVLELSAPSTTQVQLDAGAGPVVATVGPDRATVAVVTDGSLVDVVNNVGSVVFTDGCGADRGWLQPDDGRFDEPTDVFAWCGGAVLLRSAYLDDVGLFDERFFLYYEDTDLSWRGQRRGWRYRTVPTSVVRHLHAATSVEGSAVFDHHVERNRLLMLVKNAGAGFVLRQFARYVLVTASYARRDLMRPVLRLRRPHGRVVRRRIGSFVSALGLLPSMLTERRALARRENVPWSEIETRLSER